MPWHNLMRCNLFSNRQRGVSMLTMPPSSLSSESIGKEKEKKKRQIGSPGLDGKAHKTSTTSSGMCVIKSLMFSMGSSCQGPVLLSKSSPTCVPPVPAGWGADGEDRDTPEAVAPQDRLVSWVLETVGDLGAQKHQAPPRYKLSLFPFYINRVP